MRRGEIWTVAGGKDYAGKPRPVVVVQDDSFDATNSITMCAFTTDETDAPLFRLPVQPNDRNGLSTAGRLMVDKISTVPKSKLGARVGRLDDEDILRLNQAILVFLGLAVSPRVKQEARRAMDQSAATVDIGAQTRAECAGQQAITSATGAERRQDGRRARPDRKHACLRDARPGLTYNAWHN
jgi:mRNA interferase MazF